MGSAGQGAARSANGDDSFDAEGYVMVVMLIAMAVTAVWMTAALPSWRQQVIREREAELVFRGEAIARAIYLYRQKNGQALPQSLDVLVQGKYLRKKYRDPIADKDFLPVGAAQVVPGGAGGVGAGGRGQAGVGAGAPGAAAGPLIQGGIMGVRSTSQDTSIRIYNNQTSYSQWAFDFTLEQLRAGGGAAGLGGVPAGGRGAPGVPGGAPGGARGGVVGPGGPGNVPPGGVGGVGSRGGTGQIPPTGAGRVGTGPPGR